MAQAAGEQVTWYSLPQDDAVCDGARLTLDNWSYDLAVGEDTMTLTPTEEPDYTCRVQLGTYGELAAATFRMRRLGNSPVLATLYHGERLALVDTATGLSHHVSNITFATATGLNNLSRKTLQPVGANNFEYVYLRGGKQDWPDITWCLKNRKKPLGSEMQWLLHDSVFHAAAQACTPQAEMELLADLSTFAHGFEQGPVALDLHKAVCAVYDTSTPEAAEFDTKTGEYRGTDDMVHSILVQLAIRPNIDTKTRHKANAIVCDMFPAVADAVRNQGNVYDLPRIYNVAHYERLGRVLTQAA